MSNDASALPASQVDRGSPSAGLAVIIGVSNYVNPKATLAGIVPGFNYFAAWYVLAVVAYLLIGIETRGRTIEEIDATLTRPKPLAAPSSS